MQTPNLIIPLGFNGQVIVWLSKNDSEPSIFSLHYLLAFTIYPNTNKMKFDFFLPMGDPSCCEQSSRRFHFQLPILQRRWYDWFLGRYCIQSKFLRCLMVVFWKKVKWIGKSEVNWKKVNWIKKYLQYDEENKFWWLHASNPGVAQIPQEIGPLA